MGAKGNIVVGLVLFAVGLTVTLASMNAAGPGGRYVFAYGAMAVGLVQAIRGFIRLREEREDARVTLATPPRPISGAFSADDYPAEAIEMGAEGRVELGYTIDEAGRVGDLRVIVSSGNEALDEAAKAILASRFSYEPALNMLGEPIAYYRQQSIDWILPVGDDEDEASRAGSPEPGEDDLPAATTSKAAAPFGYIEASMHGDVWSDARLRELYQAGWFNPSTRFYPTDWSVSAERAIAADPEAFGYAARVDPHPDDWRDKYDHQYDMEGPYPAPDLSLVKGTFRGWVVLRGAAQPLGLLFPEETRARRR